MLESNGHIHVFSPGAGADNPLGSVCFSLTVFLVNIVHCCNFSPLNDFVTVFPIQMYRQPNLILP